MIGTAWACGLTTTMTDFSIEDETAADKYMSIRNETETIQEGGKSGPLKLK